MSKKTASIIGIIVGIIIIIIGFSIQDTSNYGIGESIKFGADFYTEMYAVTKDVGRAINNAINDLICAIGWLIVVIGLFDIAYFIRKMVSCKEDDSNIAHSAVTSIATPPENPSMQSRTYSATHDSMRSPGADEWKCICGRIHKHYVSSCSCGASRHEIVAAQNIKKD